MSQGTSQVGWGQGGGTLPKTHPAAPERAWPGGGDLSLGATQAGCPGDTLPPPRGHLHPRDTCTPWGRCCSPAQHPKAMPAVGTGWGQGGVGWTAHRGRKDRQKEKAETGRGIAPRPGGQAGWVVVAPCAHSGGCRGVTRVSSVPGAATGGGSPSAGNCVLEGSQLGPDPDPVSGALEHARMGQSILQVWSIPGGQSIPRDWGIPGGSGLF